jgi:ferric-dicitrate binding protein FerR (iron transport regulator)
MNRIPEYIEELLTSLFSGEITDTEATTLKEWVEASGDNARLLDDFRNTHFALTYYARHSRYDVDRAWKNIAGRLRETPAGGRLQRTARLAWRYAAVFVLAFAGGMAAMYFLSGQERQEDVGDELFYTEHTVPYGSKSKVILPDSSTIWLNAGSKLRYSSAFNRTEREVFIEGEAYFNVSRNEAKPFFVKNAAVTLKVLGTSFNIKAYPEEDHVETTVESGSVQVVRNVRGQLVDKLVLTAGQKATIIKSAGIDTVSLSADRKAVALVPTQKNILPETAAEKTIVTKNVMTEPYTSWKDARWLIRREPLESLAVKLERRYNIHIAFADESLKHISFSGTLRDETLEQVLQAIKLSAPVNYMIQKNTVTLSANKWIAPKDNKD